MNICNVTLLSLGLLGAAHVFASEPACLPTAVVLANVPNNPKAQEAARQADKLCRQVAIEPKPGGNPSVVRTWKLAFAPKALGGDRLKPAAPMGMPTGEVMPRSGQVELNASEALSEGLLSLDVQGPLVNVHLRPLPASASVQLPVSQLRQGAEYRWVLTTQRQRYEGTFSLPDTETLRRIDARLLAVAGLQANAAAQLLLEAAIYDDEELFASRDLVIVLLRRELQN